jgi:hypothetical protein
LAVRLTDYPDKGYFPFNTTFKVEVKIEVKLSPNSATSYTYKIGTTMAPLLYQVNLNQGTSSVTVNGQTENIQETYGIVVSQIT